MKTTGAIVAVLALAASCGPEPLAAAFTSRVVQREVCRVIGTRPEVCTREEATIDLRVRLVEREDERLWLYGIPRNGVSDRAIFGTRDSRDGFLFADSVVQEVLSEDGGSGCVLTEQLEISIAIEESALPEAIGTDPCVALVGRETEVTVTSLECDTVNEPPLPSTLTARRRWEKPLECAP